MGNRVFLPIPKLTPSDLCRFWSKVEFGPFCWLWEGPITNRALQGPSEHYGTFGIGQVTYIATRIAWRIYYNEDPGNLLVCHFCNNSICVKKDHLYLGTEKENAEYAALSKSHKHHGSLNPSAKFDESDIIEIRKESESKTAAQIGRERGVSRNAISDILRRNTWSHV